MYLSSVRLSAFKAFPEASVTFDRTGAVIFIGQNNVGKSALMNAIDAVAGQAVEGPLAFLADEPTVPVSIVAQFSFSDAEKDVLNRLYSTTEIANLVGPRFTFGEAAPGGTPSSLIVKSIEIAPAGAPTFEIASVDRSPNGTAVVTRKESGQWFIPRGTATRTPTGVVSPVPDLFQYIPPDELYPVRALLEWRARFHHFKALRTGTSRRGSSQADPRLEPTGANLPNHLLWLRSWREDDWNQIRATLCELIPGAGRLALRHEGNTVEVGFEAGQKALFQNIKDLGTGVEQLLLMLVVGQTTASSILAIEEPETNLHAGAQRELSAHINAWASRYPVVIATHSPVLLDAVEVSRLYEVRRDGARSSVSEVAGVDDRSLGILESLGVRHGDILSSERLLLVEGEQTDRVVLQAWFPELRRRGLVAIVPTRGGDAVWYLDMVREIVERADRLPRPMLFLRDRDELPPSALQRLGALPHVHVLQRRELENYLLMPDAIVAVLRERIRDDSAPEPEDIARSLRSIADSLKYRVVLSRLLQNAASLRTVRPVERRDREQLYASPEPVAEIARLVEGKLLGAVGHIAELTEEFRREEAEVNQEWDERWQDLVPGADLLTGLFSHYGVRFQKARDGQALAYAMGQPPDELVDVVTALMA